MSVAYKNKLNPIVLFKNADEIIEQHNLKNMSEFIG